MLRLIVRSVRKVRNLLKVLELKARGVDVGFSSFVHPSVRIYPGGGQVRIGSGTTLCEGVIVRAFGGSVRIGKNCSFNPYCVIDGAGGLIIGDDVRVAAHVVIVPSNHIFSDPDSLIREQGLSKQGIVIRDDVWIGSGVTVLDGVVIGHGSVVAAGAVVSRNVEPYTVVAGVPAKQISVRGHKVG